jgi:kynureninase
MDDLYQRALALDEADPLRDFRPEFYLPLNASGEPMIYFCGHSLGLPPRSVTEYVQQELSKWQTQGVEGHFAEPRPWVGYHKLLKPALAHIVGAQEQEVVAMNNLTTNLHLMLVSFYRPTAQRYKILLEAEAFPSDHYAVESQLRYHGYDPQEATVKLRPRADETTLRTEDIIQAVQDPAVALLLWPGVQYYTGQWFDIPAITEAARQQGVTVGLDLAHAVGNVPLHLHDWDVDFAVWCSYKYLNAGPGNTGGLFVHERYAHDTSLPRFAGWWGHDEAERFRMQPGFKPMPGADGWQLSNVNVLSLAAQRASLAITERAGMTTLRRKSVLLTGFLEDCLLRNGLLDGPVRLVTPRDPEARGCQLSLTVAGGKQVFDALTRAGVVADWRDPNVIRVAPVPLYNTFVEVYRFGALLAQALKINIK